jgi:hypothetical protein
MLAHVQGDERQAYYAELAHSVSPGLNLFLNAILSGLLLGLAFRFDQRTLLLIAALAAPSMAPLAGMALASVSGSMRVFLRLLAAWVLASAIAAAISGAVGGLWIPPFAASHLPDAHAALNPVDLAVLLVGSLLMCTSLARGKKVNPLASAAVAFELLTPAGVIVLGLFRAYPELWQGALFTFATHLAWTMVVCVTTLLILGFRPLGTRKRSLSIALLLTALVACAAIAVTAVYVLSFSPLTAAPPEPTATLFTIPTATLTASPSATPMPTATSTNSPTPENTSTPTVTPTPTTVTALVWGTGELGATLREEPTRDSQPLEYLLEGTLLEIIGEPQQVDGETWWNVRFTYNGEIIEGWILEGLLATITPTPSPTPTP